MTTVTTKAIRGARPEPIWEKRGGQAVGGLGNVLLWGGLLAAALAAIALQWLWPAGIVGYLVAFVIALLTAPLGLFFRHAAGKLTAEGIARERQATLDTVDQLAQANGGAGVTAEELARLGGVSEEKADAILTNLAQTGDLRLEVSDDGDLLYYPKVQRLRAGGDDVKAIQHSASHETETEDTGSESETAGEQRGARRS